MFYFRLTVGDYAGLDTLLILYLLNVKDHIPSLEQWCHRDFVCFLMVASIKAAGMKGVQKTLHPTATCKI